MVKKQWFALGPPPTVNTLLVQYWLLVTSTTIRLCSFSHYHSISIAHQVPGSQDGASLFSLFCFGGYGDPVRGSGVDGSLERNCSFDGQSSHHQHTLLIHYYHSWRSIFFYNVSTMFLQCFVTSIFFQNILLFINYLSFTILLTTRFIIENLNYQFKYGYNIEHFIPKFEIFGHYYSP